MLASGIWKQHILPDLSHVLLLVLPQKTVAWTLGPTVIACACLVPRHTFRLHWVIFFFNCILCFKQGNPLPNVLLPFLSQIFSVFLSSPFHSTPEWQNPCTPGPSASLGCCFGDLNSSGVMAKGFTEGLSRGPSLPSPFRTTAGLLAASAVISVFLQGHLEPW